MGFANEAAWDWNTRSENRMTRLKPWPANRWPGPLVAGRDLNPRPSGYEPESGVCADQGKLAKRPLRTHFWYASVRVLDRPIAPSRAMEGEGHCLW